MLVELDPLILFFGAVFFPSLNIRPVATIEWIEPHFPYSLKIGLMR